MKQLGFFPRLFFAFLLVILVAASVLYAVGNTLAPTFLEGHLEAMGVTHHNVPVGTEGMLVDLSIAYRNALTQSLVWAIFASLVIAGSLSFFITSQIAKPLSSMRKATRRISKGEYKERVAYLGPSEISDLAADFNTMANSLETVEAQRSDLIRNLAHEFRTPLMNLRGYIEGVEDGVFQLNEETVLATKRQLERLERLMNDLSLLSRVDAKRETVKPERSLLEAICHAALDSVRPQFVKKGVELRCEVIASDLLVMADPIRTEQVLTNLLTNALRHTSVGDDVVLWVSQDAKRAFVHVEDTGEGIAKEALAHVFKRFYRADSNRDSSTGSGIGLTIAQYFVEAQGGSLSVKSVEGEGSEFYFSLPLALQ